MFKFDVEGADSLEEEFNKDFLPRVNKALRAGLNAVASDLTASLLQHIQTDVYAKYEPHVYKRRGSNKGMADPHNITTEINDNQLSLFYQFETETPIYKDAFGKVKYRWAWYADSDDVIRAIQTNKGYPTASPLEDDCEPRPFWNNFVVDNFVGGKAEKSFVNGMNVYDSDLKVISYKRNLTDAEDAESVSMLTQRPHGQTFDNFDITDDW